MTTDHQPPPITDGTPPRVVIVGAGFGGLAAARALANEPARVTVCDRLNYHLFQPLLYQVALASLSATDVAMPIRSILHERNIEVLLADVAGVDLGRRQVRMVEGDPVRYDYLILAAGARTNYYGHEDWAAYAPGLKDLDDALEIRDRVLLAFESAEREPDPAERRRLLTFVVIGGGATGVELAGALADLSRDILRRDFRHVRHDDTRVVLLEGSPRLLSSFDPGLSTRARDQLEDLGVEVHTATPVQRIDQRGVWVGAVAPAERERERAAARAGVRPPPEEFIAAATVLWGAGVAPSPLTRGLGATLDRAGRVVVEQDCSLPGHREVFVIGDMAAFTPAGSDRLLPGISPVAIQQGRAAAHNILRDGRGEPRAAFEYFDKGVMATIGRARAVAELRGLKLWGLVAWLAWVFVHLWYLVGFRNRLAVFVNWIWSYVIAKHGARLITGRHRSASLDTRRASAAPEPPLPTALAPPS
jgi:NADH dehydrogenase